MSIVFLSYRRDDAAAHTGRLYDYLLTRFSEEQIFIDVEDIAPGQDFLDVIENRIAACDLQLVVIGARWATIADANGRPRLSNPADVVRLEIAAALRRGISVIPVLVGGAVMPRSEDLPADIAALARRHAFEISDNHFRRDAEALLELLDQAATGGRGGLDGRWQAELNYGPDRWDGGTHQETFEFRTAGDELLGTASFLGHPRPILEGRVRGNSISFTTRWLLIPEGSGSQENHYRGKLAGNDIHFVYQSMDGSLPVQFTATRVRPET